LLKDVPGISYSNDLEGVVHNYPYFAIRVDSGEYGLSRDELCNRLKEYNVFTRKYFYPLCSRLRCYSDLPSAAPERLPAAEKIAGQVLSLPLYGSLCSEDVGRICEMIRTIRESG
jgi:dTDP-4-amino-4,6-dideoxygalactose transaminase